MVRTLLLLSLFLSLSFSHGLFYSVYEGKAVVINANFTKEIPAAYANISIYEGESAIPLLSSKLDRKGNFAFLPPSAGEYRVKITVNSDHGAHDKEFNISVDKNGLNNYEEPLYKKYLGILSAIGLIFGIFGVVTLVKTRKA